MATTFVAGTFNGSTAQINLTFGYLDKTHVYVYLNGVLKTVGVDYVWNSPAQIEMLGGNPVAGTAFLAQRRTPTALGVEFAPGNLDSSDLNFGFLQAIYIAEEAQDSVGQKWGTLEGGTGKTIQAVGTASGNILVYDASGNLIDSDVNILAISEVAPNVALALQYRNEAAGFRTEASNYAVSASGYATQALGYRDAANGYVAQAQLWATSMTLVGGVDFSAKYYANQAYLNGGVPIGTIIDVYGNGTTTPPGYLKVIPGLEITSAYPELRAWALANGWATNGGGNPVFPSTDDALFKRQWRAGQSLRDAGRAFGTVQDSDNLAHTHGVTDPGHTHSDTLNLGSAVGGGLGIVGNNNNGNINVVNSNTTGISIESSGGLEARPANITVTWFIKAYDAPLDTATVAAAQVLADLADVRARALGMHEYVSPEQVITAGGALTLAHGLGGAPKIIHPVLICKSVDGGYAVGDIIPLNPSGATAASNDFGASFEISGSTNILIRYGTASGVFLFNNKTTGGLGNITPANWRLVVRAWR